jgi:AraC-like DNA-binding protein
LKHSESTDLAVVAAMMEALRRQPVDVAAIFEQLGLAECWLALQQSEPPRQRIALDDYGRLLRSIWQTMDDEAGGHLSRPLRVGTFRMMCHALITAGNLRRALLRSARFIGLLTDELSLQLEEKGDEARFYIRFDNPHRLDETFFITSLYVIWLRLSSWLIDRPILPERIQFAFVEPSFIDEYPLMFPCRLGFGKSEHVLVFGRAVLDAPIRQDTETLARFLEGAPISLLTWFRSDRSITAQVKRRLLTREGLNTQLDLGSFEQVAQGLGLSTHTLRRRLRDEGHSFQQIKDTLRRGRAVHLLQNTALPVASIAEALGFSEPAAFTRAFKKWTGLPPAEFRAHS